MDNNISIDTLLGQSFIFQKITQNIDKDRVILLKGETGYGKTYLLNKVMQYCKTTMKNSVSFLLENNIYSYDYAPFLLAISQNESLFLNNGINILKTYVDMVPVIGKALEKSVSLKRSYPSEFTVDEINILTQIKKAAQGKKVILFCDEISSWDEPSLVFLIKLIKYKDDLGHFFPLSCICTDSASSDLYDKLFTVKYDLKPFNSIHSVQIVNALFPDNKLDEDTIKNICSICNYNIGIIIQVVSNINSTNAFSDKEIRNLFISKLPEKENVSLLLDKASIIGITSYKSILQKFVKLDDFHFQISLDSASEASLLRDEKEQVKFVNECVWSVFHEYNKNNKQYHHDLAKCLESVMPSSHKRIGGEYILSGFYENAAVHFVQSAIFYYITYRIKPLFTAQEKELINKYNLMFFCNRIIELYDNYYHGTCQEEEDCPLTNYDVLDFESDYYKAFLCINESIDQTCYEHVFDKLQRWVNNTSFKSESPEQWLRAALLCLETDVELHNGLNRALLSDIEQTIRAYAKTDKNIEVFHYDFMSKSNSIYSIEIAANYTYDAVSALEKNNLFYRHSYKYLIFLTNALANAIVMGEKEKAFEYSKKAIDCIAEGDIFPSSFIGTISNNIYISLLLWNRENFIKEFDSISKTMLNLIGQKDDDISTVLYKNNLAVFYLYYKDYTSAQNILKELFDLVKYNNSIDDYYAYLIKNNYYMFQYIKTGKIDVQRFDDELSALKPLDLNMKYFNARLIYMKEKLTQGYKIDLKSERWNDFESVQIGKAWFFWGKWFLLSDIQFWSE